MGSPFLGESSARVVVEKGLDPGRGRVKDPLRVVAMVGDAN